MQTSHRHSDSSERPADQLPFAAPVRSLTSLAALHWLKLGWQDFKRAPRQSLTYGAVVVVISYIVSLLALNYGNLYSLLTLASGFMLVGPVVAIGLYSISCQIQENKTPVLGHCLREGRRHFAIVIVFGFILLVVFLIWIRSASMLHVFYPVQANSELSGYFIFYGVGTVVGAVFSAIIFCASALSLPMIMDRKADMVTAVITSINAVLKNKKAMLVWATIIFLSVVISFATAFIGFLILLPVIGHATWHAYQETIDASQWPRHN